MDERQKKAASEYLERTQLRVVKSADPLLSIQTSLIGNEEHVKALEKQ